MWSGILGLLETTWDFGTRVDRGFGFLLIVIIIVATVFGFQGNPILFTHLSAWCIGADVIFFVAIVPPMKRMAAERHVYLTYVAVWGLIALTIFVSSFYFVFYAITDGHEANGTTWDRILTLPPVIGAVVGAAIGWYVHQELSAKLHRTANSFNLVMQTRTSAQFIEHMRLLRSVYPSTIDSIPTEDEEFFSGKKRIELEKSEIQINAGTKELSPQQKEKHLEDLKKLEAIEGLKYILNFYEFMALGIKAGDLDETLLYETVSPSVVGWCKRSHALCDVIRGGPSNKLAFQHLSQLVYGYTKKVGRKQKQVEGWERRLEREKANV